MEEEFKQEEVWHQKRLMKEDEEKRFNLELKRRRREQEINQKEKSWQEKEKYYQELQEETAKFPEVLQQAKEKVVKEDYPIEQAKADHRFRKQGLDHIMFDKPDISDVVESFSNTLEKLIVEFDKLIENWEHVDIDEQKRFIRALSRLYSKIREKGDEAWTKNKPSLTG